jgi:hypothetical protein
MLVVIASPEDVEFIACASSNKGLYKLLLNISFVDTPGANKTYV